ncbi:PHD finger protein ING1 [Dichanthelium oligosanthes]|uniref:PHD finger protein ING1 n=1 Tax=Dichanthelium oligosanthes TaxID=888268 RepID=A0A1E5VQI8_9POAL|nr:PHD finger protein ING1 [Dichanthelium oligosanthes]
MGFLEDFQASVESLPSMLQRNYSLMRELDKSLQGVQLENEQRCQQEIEDIKHGLESGSITYDPAKLKFSEEAIEEQKHCVRIADEKVALATQTYDLVDAHIQQLDQFMRKLEEIRQVQDRVVSHWLCGREGAAQGKVVLPKLRRIPEEAKRQMIF